VYLPFVEVAAGEDAHICQVGFVELFANMDAVGNYIAAIQADGRKCVAIGFLRTQGDLDGRLDSDAWIVGVEQQGVAVVGAGDGLECFFFGGEEFDQRVRDGAGSGQAIFEGGIEQGSAGASADVGGARDS
jgi:hypothetical protein